METQSGWAGGRASAQAGHAPSTVGRCQDGGSSSVLGSGLPAHPLPSQVEAALYICFPHRPGTFRQVSVKLQPALCCQLGTRSALHWRGGTQGRVAAGAGGSEGVRKRSREEPQGGEEGLQRPSLAEVTSKMNL